MTPEQFTIWLNKLLDKSGDKGLSKKQTQIVKDKAKEVKGTMTEQKTSLILSC